MVMNILFVIGLVILATFFAKIVDVYRKKEKRAQAYRMSFRETLDLTNIPIVTFMWRKEVKLLIGHRCQ